jgi:hypothetical protein
MITRHPVLARTHTHIYSFAQAMRDILGEDPPAVQLDGVFTLFDAKTSSQVRICLPHSVAFAPPFRQSRRLCI